MRPCVIRVPQAQATAMPGVTRALDGRQAHHHGPSAQESRHDDRELRRVAARGGGGDAIDVLGVLRRLAGDIQGAMLQDSATGGALTAARGDVPRFKLCRCALVGTGRNPPSRDGPATASRCNWADASGRQIGCESQRRDEEARRIGCIKADHEAQPDAQHGEDDSARNRMSRPNDSTKK